MRHVLVVQRREFKGNHRDIGWTLVVIALRQFMSRDLGAMQTTLAEAALIFANQKEGQSFLVGMLEFSNAASARRQRKYAVAERHYKVAIGNMEKAVGRNHLFGAAVKMDLCGMYYEQGRMVEFERLGREVLDGIDVHLFPRIPC